MGWKSTINITRGEAIKAIVEQMVTLNDKTSNKVYERITEEKK